MLLQWKYIANYRCKCRSEIYKEVKHYIDYTINVILILKTCYYKCMSFKEYFLFTLCTVFLIFLDISSSVLDSVADIRILFTGM